MTKKKIEKLTQEQVDKFPEYVEKWIKIGHSTKPLDKVKVREAIYLLYEKGGLPPPKNIIFVESPIAAINYLTGTYPQITKDVVLNNFLWGSGEAYWLSMYDFFLRELNFEECHQLDGLFYIAEECGWLSVFDDLVVVQAKPKEIHFDDQRRLHKENGPALSYNDGYALYFWHGISVPKEWIIDPDKNLTPEIALKWENLEQKRCACEILGWAKVLNQLDSKVIDADDDPQIGTLLEVNFPNVGREYFLQVLCGTNRTFAIPVPPTMTTALEANAWTYGLDNIDLKNLEIRT